MSKKAILIVHFGTTHLDTMKLTIDNINEKFKNEFKDYDFYEAYTSRIIIKRLREKNIYKYTPLEMLSKITSEGYEELLVQSTHIIAGIEYDNLVDEIYEYKDRFKKVNIGKPLLYHPEDYKKVVKALSENLITKDEYANIFACHGTNSPIGASYAMLEYMFDEAGYHNVYTVSTMSFPNIEDVIPKIKKRNIKYITLMPFMFVAGEHAKKDMAIKFKEKFEANGINADKILIKGLGEYDMINEIFVAHSKDAINNEEFDIKEFKKSFII